MNKDVCVYILTHNRPNDILRSLNSVRRQNFPNLRIVVSDNSDNDTTFKLLKDVIESDKRISYIRRGDNICVFRGVVSNRNFFSVSGSDRNISKIIWLD